MHPPSASRCSITGCIGATIDQESDIYWGAVPWVFLQSYWCHPVFARFGHLRLGKGPYRPSNCRRNPDTDSRRAENFKQVKMKARSDPGTVD